jgi:hypothetical protein
MWVELSVGGAADLAKRNPEGATAPEAYTVLLYEVAAYTIFTPLLFLSNYSNNLFALTYEKNVLRLLEYLKYNYSFPQMN